MVSAINLVESRSIWVVGLWVCLWSIILVASLRWKDLPAVGGTVPWLGSEWRKWRELSSSVHSSSSLLYRACGVASHLKLLQLSALPWTVSSSLLTLLLSDSFIIAIGKEADKFLCTTINATFLWLDNNAVSNLHPIRSGFCCLFMRKLGVECFVLVIQVKKKKSSFTWAWWHSLVILLFRRMRE